MYKHTPHEPEAAVSGVSLTVDRKSYPEGAEGKLLNQEGYIIRQSKAGLEGPVDGEGNEVCKGGFWRIFSVNEFPLKREIVRKVLSAEEDRTGSGIFLREAMILRELQHPNIVPLQEFALDGYAAVYHVMNRVRGRTLQDVLKEVKENAQTGGKRKSQARVKCDLQALLTIFDKVCDAVSYAHAHSLRVIHGSLKPQNILVGVAGEVHLMDWRLAKVMGNTEGFGEIISAVQAPDDAVALDGGDMNASPEYMSPEQAFGKSTEIDEASDIYALGGMLHEILTFCPPVEITEEEQRRGGVECLLKKTREGEVALRMKRARGKLKAAHCAGGLVPEALVAVVLKALCFEKKGRYPTVQALQQDVQAFLTGHATVAEKAGAWRKTVYFLTRHKAVFVSIVATGWLVALTAIASTYEINELINRAEKRERLLIAEKNEYKLESERAKKQEERAKKQAQESRTAWKLESDKILVQRFKELGVKAFRIRAFREAVLQYNEAIAIQPDASLYMLRGDAHAGLQDYEKAREDYDRVIESRYRDAKACFKRGMMKARLNNTDGAIEDYESAVREDPLVGDVPEKGVFVEAYINRGHAKKNQNKSREAIQDYSHAIEMDPTHALAYVWRADVKRSNAEYRGAILDYSMAIHLDSKCLPAFAGRGAAKFDSEDFAGALLDCNQAVELDSSNALAHAHRGAAKYNMEDYAGALLDLNKAVELGPLDAWARLYRGFAKHDLDDFAGAILDFSKVIDKLDPNDAEAFISRGYARDCSGDYAGAIFDYDKAVDLDNNNAYAYFVRGKGKCLIKDYAGAVADFNSALKLDPTSRKPLYYLWATHVTRGEEEKADSVISSMVNHFGENAEIEAWEGSIEGYIVGTLPQEQMLEAAAAEGPTPRATRLCQALYFMGVKAIANGDKAKAAEEFRKLIRTKSVKFIEYQMAELGLEELGGK